MFASVPRVFSLTPRRLLGLAGALLVGGAAHAQPLVLDPVTAEPVLAPATRPTAIADDGGPSAGLGGGLTLVARLAEGETRGVALVGDVLYRSNGGYLETLDVTNPAEPVVLGRFLAAQGVVQGVAVQGTLAYVPVNRGTPYPTRGSLQIVDVSNPANPQGVGQVAGRSFFDVAVSGTIAYGATGGGGLRLFDVSNPASPAALGFLTVSGGSVLSVALDGTTAYLAAGNAGLRAVDVSNPAAPAALGNLTFGGFATRVVLSGGRAYVAVNDVGLVVVDVSNPSAPVELGRFPIASSQVRSVAVAGTTAYVGRDDGFVAVNVANPAAMTLLDALDFGVSGSGQSIVLDGPTAYVGNRFSGVRVIDVSNPSDLSETALIDNGGFSFKVNVVNGVAYVADLLGQLRIVDLSNPSAPFIVGRVRGLTNANGVDVEGGVAYVAHRGTFDPPTGLLTRVDVSNPAAPTVLGSTVTPWWAYGIDVVGPTVYAATGNNGTTDGSVRTYDRTTGLTFLDEETTGNQAFDVRVANGRAYVATFGSGLSILDVSDPANMAPISLNSVGGFASSLEVSGSTVYMADSEFGTARALTVVDVSNPASPQLLDTGDGISGGSAVDVAYASGRAYVTVDFVGLYAFDVSNPTDVTPTTNVTTADRATGVDAENGLVVVADAGAGLWIFSDGTTTANEPAAPAGRLVAEAAPNPFRTEAALRYYLPEAAAVTVEVFSVLGARVARVELGAQGAGWHEVALDGRGWAAGLYVYRLTAGADVATGRLTRTR